MRWSVRQPAVDIFLFYPSVAEANAKDMDLGQDERYLSGRKPDLLEVCFTFESVSSFFTKPSFLGWKTLNPMSAAGAQMPTSSCIVSISPETYYGFRSCVRTKEKPVCWHEYASVNGERAAVMAVCRELEAELEQRPQSFYRNVLSASCHLRV